MNTLKNKVQLLGNLGAAPEIRTIESGRKLAKLRLATNETYKNSEGEKVTDTQWHNVVAWGATADVAERFLDKGSEVLVEGKLQYRDYTDKDGIKRTVAEIQAVNLLLLDKKVAA